VAMGVAIVRLHARSRSKTSARPPKIHSRDRMQFPIMRASLPPTKTAFASRPDFDEVQ
jgi:hypothetical protein